MKKILIFLLFTCFANAQQVSTPYWTTTGINSKSNFWFGTRNNFPLSIRTNNVERLVINTDNTITLNGYIASSGQFLTTDNNGKLVFGTFSQVNANWNATSGNSQILNKPNLSLVATTGNYNDLLNKPTIPTQYTNTMARGSISLTTTGTGSATYNNTTGVFNIPTPNNGNVIGDVKQSVNIADHNGWVRLNGRAKNTLTTTQQTQATGLGIGTNIPNQVLTIFYIIGTANKPAYDFIYLGN